MASTSGAGVLVATGLTLSQADVLAAVINDRFAPALGVAVSSTGPPGEYGLTLAHGTVQLGAPAEGWGETLFAVTVLDKLVAADAGLTSG